MVNFGVVGVYQLACNEVAAAGVSLKVTYIAANPDGTTPYYVRQIGSGEYSPGNQTDATGLVTALNVKPGGVRVQMTRTGADGKIQIVSDVSAVVKAGWMTYFSMTPTPPLDQQ
jgi:hypothetical protein